MVPTLVNNGLLDAAGAAAFTALLVQQTKFLIEYAVKPTNAQHDNVIRLYVDLVAMAVIIIAEVVSGTMNVHSGAAWFTAVIQGFGVAILAIAGYHLLNGMQPQSPPAKEVAAQPAPTLDDSAILAALQRLLDSTAASARVQVIAPAPANLSAAPASIGPTAAEPVSQQVLPEENTRGSGLALDATPSLAASGQNESTASFGPVPSTSSDAVANDLTDARGASDVLVSYRRSRG